MVDVAGDVAAWTAVDGPLGVHAEEIPATTLFDFFVRDARTGVLDDAFAFGNRFQSKQSESGGSTPYFVFSIAVVLTQCSKFPLLCSINLLVVAALLQAQTY